MSRLGPARPAGAAFPRLSAVDRLLAVGTTVLDVKLFLREPWSFEEAMASMMPAAVSRGPCRRLHKFCRRLHRHPCYRNPIEEVPANVASLQFQRAIRTSGDLTSMYPGVIFRAAAVEEVPHLFEVHVPRGPARHSREALRAVARLCIGRQRVMQKFDFLRPAVERSWFHVDTPLGLDVRLFANAEVPFERDSFEQLFEFLDVARAVAEVRDLEARGGAILFGDAPAGIDRVVLTPDFHKGSLIPVGTVVRAQHLSIPQASGNDVCCGMRLLATDLPAQALEPHWPAIQKRLRAIFFAGERDIPMSPRQREAVLREGLPGLLRTAEDNVHRGIWRRFDVEAARDDLVRVHAEGHFETHRLFGFENLIRSSGEIDGRDPQIGCVGGGNHFVEIQRVDALFDGHAARAWGLSKGTAAIMIHSGSVALGHAVGGHFMNRSRELFRVRVKAPKRGFYPLPMSGPLAKEGLFYLDGMGNAANFAFANRLFLGLMALRAIEEASGRSITGRLVYDAPHNLVFRSGDWNHGIPAWWMRRLSPPLRRSIPMDGLPVLAPVARRKVRGLLLERAAG